MNWDKNSEEYKEFRRKANEKNKRYYEKHRQKLILKHRAYRKNPKNIPKLRAYEKKYREEHPLNHKEWREKNKEHCQNYDKEYRKKNREKILARDKEYYYKKRQDKEYVRKTIEAQRRFRIEHPELIRKSHRKYAQSHRGFLNHTKENHKKMAVKHNNKFELTFENIDEIYNRDKFCVYCGRDYKLEMDHIIPSSKGGETIFENFVIACASCNRSKSSKDVIDWCKERKKEVPKIVIENLKKMGREIQK